MTVLLWFNSFWPSDAIWRHRSESTLDQVMACCLTAPSHYLNQCWLISKVPWHEFEGISMRRFEDIKTHPDLPGTNELRSNAIVCPYIAFYMQYTPWNMRTVPALMCFSLLPMPLMVFFSAWHWGIYHHITDGAVLKNMGEVPHESTSNYIITNTKITTNRVHILWDILRYVG